MKIRTSVFYRLEIYLALAMFIGYCIYFLPHANNEIRIHDTFDGNFSTRHVLINSGHLFDLNPTTTVPGIMNGIPRGVFPNNTEITSILMFLFGSLSGFAITFLLVKLLAFAGVYFFGKDHLEINSDNKGILILVSVLFACLPFFVIHGLSVAGIPLLLWAFFNILKRQKYKASYFVFTLFVLWSNFVLVGVHVIFCLGLLSLFYCFKEKKILYRLFLALGFILVLYIISNYMLFYMHYFNSAYHTSRGEMDKLLGLNFKGVLGGTFKTFFTGDYSTANYFGFLLIPFILCAVYFYIKGRKNELNFKIAATVFIIYVLACICVNILDWKSIGFLYEKIPFTKVFNFKRFTSLLPGLFFIFTAAVLLIYNSQAGVLKKMLTICFILGLYLFIWRGNISYNRSAFNTTGLKIVSQQQTGFNEFFEPELYKQIKFKIGSDTTKNVIHFGLSPSPSKYAGLNVLDDYQGDYPAEYKIAFRKIIAGELEKSDKLKDYFDKWGARCYLQSAGNFENKLEIKNGFLFEPELAINTNEMKLLNCHYILSGLIIGNARQLGLNAPLVVVSPTTKQTIFLYKII